MLEFVVVALFQAAAGDPAPAPTDPVSAPVEQTTAAEPTPATAPETAAAPEATGQDRVICRNVRVTGSRLRTERICRTEQQSREAGQMYRDMINRSGTRPGELAGGGRGG